jgi:hypothetical protein
MFLIFFTKLWKSLYPWKLLVYVVGNISWIESDSTTALGAF